MKSIRNSYQSVTEIASSSEDMVELNGKYTAVRFDSMRDGDKWAINKGEIPIFDDFGVIPNADDVVVGKDRSSFYLIRMQNKPKPVCRLKSYQVYNSDEFLWISGDRGELSNPVLRESGEFFIHLPTGRYIECPEPPEMVEFRSKYKLSDGTIIKWTGSGFQKKEKSEVVADGGEEKISIKDARKEELESFLSENVDLDIISGAQNMDEVDLTETPLPIVHVFYQMGEGDFPEDEDGDFEPPGQDEFAIGAYEIFKKRSDNEEAFREENRRAWIKRLKNAWASLVRDVHFSFMMYEEQSVSDSFDKVEFDKDKDVEEGIDFLIEQDGTEYHVNLFIDSQKSRRFLNKKKKYRHPETDAVAIEVPMKLWGDNKKSVGTQGEDLWLYNEEHVEGVKDIVHNDAEKVTRNGDVVCEKIGETRN